MPKVIQVIESQIAVGKGTEDNPVKTIVQYHGLDGKYLAEIELNNQIDANPKEL